jgi:hypothetical protein
MSYQYKWINLTSRTFPNHCRLFGFVLCLASNVALPLRNALTKKYGEGKDSKKSYEKLMDSFHSAFILNFFAWVATTYMCIIFMPLSTDFRALTPTATKLGLCRAVYEIASLLVLSYTDPILHGGLDVSKRAALTRKLIRTLQLSVLHFDSSKD